MALFTVPLGHPVSQHNGRVIAVRNEMTEGGANYLHLSNAFFEAVDVPNVHAATDITAAFANDLVVAYGAQHLWGHRCHHPSLDVGATMLSGSAICSVGQWQWVHHSSIPLDCRGTSLGGSRVFHWLQHVFGLVSLHCRRQYPSSQPAFAHGRPKSGRPLSRRKCRTPSGRHHIGRLFTHSIGSCCYTGGTTICGCHWYVAIGNGRRACHSVFVASLISVGSMTRCSYHQFGRHCAWVKLDRSTLASFCDSPCSDTDLALRPLVEPVVSIDVAKDAGQLKFIDGRESSTGCLSIFSFFPRPLSQRAATEAGNLFDQENVGGITFTLAESAKLRLIRAVKLPDSWPEIKRILFAYHRWLQVLLGENHGVPIAFQAMVEQMEGLSVGLETKSKSDRSFGTGLFQSIHYHTWTWARKQQRLATDHARDNLKTMTTTATTFELDLPRGAKLALDLPRSAILALGTTDALRPSLSDGGFVFIAK
jgi:hypothetical protein